jgi:NADPH-dependent 2,4-dienoyl-CoA reductase/sulfur reductase-like enzyme
MLQKQVSNMCKVGAGASFLYMGSNKSVSTLHFKAPHNPRNLLQVDDLENKIKGDNYYSLKSRADHLEDVKNNPNYDFLVIGGGATGAGVAFDASSRGLRVLVVDSYDFASGTSSKSSKLLHGGIRYLGEVFKMKWGVDRAGNWKLVKEALQEKSTVQNSAPYMTSNLHLVIPNTNIFEAIHKWLGVLMYTLIGKWMQGEYEYIDCGSPQW